MVRRRGFTLIELLVVVVVIAILAGILFPVFGEARDRARQASCLSNVKQIALALLVYADDYDDRHPSRPALHQTFCVPGPEGSWDYQPTILGNAPPSIAALLDPYVRNTQIYLCPNDPTGDRSYGAPLEYYSTRYMRCTYEGNDGMIWGFRWPTYPSGRPSISMEPVAFAELSHPALLPIVWEYNAHHGTGELWYRGKEPYMVAYADGHARFTRAVEGQVPTGRRPWYWSEVNPRRPLDITRPCDPTCAEEATRLDG